MFNELNEKDYFGLFVRHDLSTAETEESLDILLDEKGNNVAVKQKILHKLLSQENMMARRGNGYMKQISYALSQSAQLPEKIIKF